MLASKISNFSLSLNLVLLSSILRISCHSGGNHSGCSKMRSQVVLLDEFLITVVAVEWFFTSVKPFMHSQVVLLDEFLVTVVAIEWLFSNALSGCPSGRISYHSGSS